MAGFWKDKRVLITGYEGFLGSHLAADLVSKGAAVTGLDILTHRKETILSADDYKMMKVVRGSVEDLKLLLKILKQNRIESVFHLAATSIVGEALGLPLKAFSTNIEGTWNILEACRRTPQVRSVVIASSDKAYGSHKKLPYLEGEPLCGDHPYDVSKSCADLLANAYFHTYGLPLAITRCGNIYGPGDFNFSRLIPDAMRCLALKKTLQVRSDGEFIRDYVYVADIVRGYTRIAECLEKGRFTGEAFNLSNEEPVSVKGLLTMIEKTVPEGRFLRYKIKNAVKYEIKKQFLCSRKARKLLRWQPDDSLASGLKKTAAWYLNYFKK